MHLSFRYPAAWQAAGDTFVSTGGSVGRAELATGTRGSLRELMTASCARRGAVIGAHGIFVTWSANIGSPIPVTLAAYPGQVVRVDGHPARWSDQASTICFKGRIINGVIEESPRVFLYLSADVGSAVPRPQISALRTIFNSARS
jgi:hypothetical protein